MSKPFGSKMMERRLLGLMAPLVLLAHTVYGQATTNATCLPGTDWMQNSKGHSPCLVSAYLSSQCNAGSWLVPALVTQGPYNPPSGAGANRCRCNTVLYSLISACSSCQGGLVGTWRDWISFCPANFVTVADYPNVPPSETAIPEWAFVDPSMTGAWNATEAQVIATTKTKSGGSNIGPIVGGVVGGIAALALIGALVWLWIRRRKAKGDKVTPVPYTDPSLSTTYQPEKSMPSRMDLGTPAPLLPMTSSTPAPTFKPYDPSDPSTFPSMMGGGYDSHSKHGHSVGSHSPGGVFPPYQDYPQSQFGGTTAYSGTPPPMMQGFNQYPYPPQSPAPKQPGAYTGAAEL